MPLSDNSNINPIVINFNSKDRVSGSNSSFLSNPVDLGQNSFDSVCLVQASLPKSFYNMPSRFNTFTLTEGVTSVTVTIPVGNYTRINLQSTLATVLTLASPNLLTYTVSYPASTAGDTFHYTFESNSAVIVSKFTFTTNESPFRQLGFEDNTTNTFTAGVGISTLESVNGINLSFILRAFIKTNLVLDATNGILEEILNYGSFPSSSVVHYQQYNFDMNSRRYNPDNKNSWQFSLVDAFDNLIDMNGIPFAFSVVFYQRNKTHEIHKNDLMIANEERLFKIEQEQKKIETEVQSTAPLTMTSSIAPTKLEDFTPIYPITPSFVTTQFLPTPNIKK